MTKVLVVVEDDVDMQLLITITLQSDGRLELCGAATTAEEAVRLARESQPDLVILDHFIQGEVMGLQAAPMIKQVAPAAKILLFTSHDLATEASRESAIDAFLQKSYLPNLLPTAQRLLGLDPLMPQPV